MVVRNFGHALVSDLIHKISTATEDPAMAMKINANTVVTPFDACHNARVRMKRMAIQLNNMPQSYAIHIPCAEPIPTTSVPARLLLARSLKVAQYAYIPIEQSLYSRSSPTSYGRRCLCIQVSEILCCERL